MPKRRTVRSLEKMCFETVAENMKHVWASDYRDNFLPGFYVLKLIQFLGMTKCLTPALLDSLLMPRLTELDLSSCPKLVKRDVARIIAARCKTLSSMNLNGCKWIPADALVCLVEGLPSLIKLDLSRTQCNRQVLSALGSSCRQLHQLNISRCKNLPLAFLPYLAYDRTQDSFSCQKLHDLTAYRLGGGGDMFSALIFVLLALPKLKYVGHELVSEAVVMIHKQDFRDAQLPRGFPSLTELVEHVMSTHIHEGNFRLTLPLRKVDQVGESHVPLISAVCPLLVNMDVDLGSNSDLVQRFLSCCHLTHLTLSCRESSPTDLRDLLPVTATLGAQLQVLVLNNFSFVDEYSFNSLLHHCRRLQEFTVSFLAPQRHGHERQPDAESMDWDFILPPLEFPHLLHCCLEYIKTENPLPSYHAMVLRECIVSLMKQSPCLTWLNFTCLPFSLDEVFETVLKPPGVALQQLHELALIQSKISTHTINLLLSSENPLSVLALDGCPDICRQDLNKFRKRISKAGLDLKIQWN